MECPHKNDCPLYGHFGSQSLLAIWKATYCDGKFEQCERFKLSRSGAPVPLNLLPNGKLLNIKMPAK